MLDEDASNWVVYARYNGLADQNHYDFFDNGNGTIFMSLPLPGLWVFSVHHINTVDTTDGVLQLAGQKPCDVGSAAPPGKGCEPIPGTTNNVTLLMTGPGGTSPTFYFRFLATPAQRLEVSVTTTNGTLLPSLYASLGQLPSPDGMNADIVNCNRDYCSNIRSIALNVTTPQEWFITVQTSLATAASNITFGIWWNQTCVPDCTKNNRGLCNPDGTCQCLMDFEGIDCAISDGLGAPYIVLIIIASLVVASAVVGFVAWAYMRRKRDNYETLA